MKEREGFTLIELLVALTIFAIFLSGPLFDIAMKMNVKVRNMNNAKMLAEEFMEQVRAYDYNSPLIADDGDAGDLDNTAHFDHQLPDTTISGIVYTRGYNIKDKSYSNNTKTIKLHILWRDGLGSHHLSFTTVRVNSNY